MPKTPEVLSKDYAALLRALEAAALQLKAAELARAQHDQSLREAAQALGQRVATLRAGRPAASADDLKTDVEVKRLLASLNERLAQAETERQRVSGLAVGAWGQALKGAAALDKALAADILARQKLPASKAGPGQIALTNLLHLQADARKKLAPRRAALLAGQKALLFVDDPLYFRAQRDQALAAVFGPPPAAIAKAAPRPAAPAKTTGGTAVPKATGSASPAQTAGNPASASPAKAVPAGSTPLAQRAGNPAPALSAKAAPTGALVSGAAASATPAPAANKLLTAAAFKVAGREARQLLAGIRASAGVARRATRAKKPRQAATARATAARRLASLHLLVKQYEDARQAAGDEAILALRDGRQLLRGIQIFVAVRERARALVNRLAVLDTPAPRRGLPKPTRRH